MTRCEEFEHALRAKGWRYDVGDEFFYDGEWIFKTTSTTGWARGGRGQAGEVWTGAGKMVWMEALFVMTADQILESIRERIISASPQLHAPGASGIDAKLFELHLLYADATDQYDAWKRLRKQEMADGPEWIEQIHEGISKPGDESKVIEYWRQFGEQIGCAPVPIE
jgi:hypothetical protein